MVFGPATKPAWRDLQPSGPSCCSPVVYLAVEAGKNLDEIVLSQVGEETTILGGGFLYRRT